ncbi:MAG: adenylosuccinate synthase [Thermosipho sp. (in: thermotogales)]|nr:adenylosuccinate synthase [Thermosipho sp. (in: thermotogales)]
MKDVIVGLQWGDEGKGKVVAFFSQFYDAVVRYSGGSNAGHTIEYNDEIKIVNHLLPSFYIKKSIELIISAGVVVDLEILYNEIENLKNKIEILPEIKISNLSHIVLPVHKKLDEKYDSVNKIGTTKRGIGPAFADRVNRLGIRIKDLENEKKLQKKIERISTIYEKIFGINFDFNDLKKFYNYLKPYITSQLEIIEDIKNKKVLFEGTQAVLLDLDMGTYPYVTGSNCSTSGVHSGIGFPVKLDNLLGVFKAYLTRVGNGPFPTELTGEEAELLRNKGKEFGATTGRPRRVGWLDLVLLKYAISVSGVNEMIMTKGDILNGLEKIPVCIGYKINGKFVDKILDIEEIEEAEPIYTYLDGWHDVKDYTFKKYIAFIEDFVGVKIKGFSFGPKVDQIKIF